MRRLTLALALLGVVGLRADAASADLAPAQAAAATSPALALAGGLVAVAGIHAVWWHLHTFGGLTPYGTNIVWPGEGTTA